MRKLLKHDIKGSYLEILILNGSLLLLTLLLILCVRARLDTISTLLLPTWLGVMIASIIVVFISMIKSFNKNLFSDYGYLTMSIPISLDKILLSKIIVNFIWVFVTLACLFSSMLILISGISGDIMFISSLFEFFTSVIGEYPLETVLVFILVVVYVLYMIMMWLVILVFSNTGRIKKNKFLKGLIAYFVLGTIVSAIQTPFSSIIQDLEFFVNLSIQIVFFLGLSVGFYFLSRYLINNHLELE